MVNYEYGWQRTAVDVGTVGVGVAISLGVGLFTLPVWAPVAIGVIGGVGLMLAGNTIKDKYYSKPKN